jgi:FkbM family methyltransferase
MSAVTLGRRFGNALYKLAFPAYRPLYSAFKAYADRAERQLLIQHLFKGAVVVDAGANIGVYSRFLSRLVGDTGSVHSFEPSPDNFAHLAKAVSTLPNVRANQLAVSDRTENKLLYVSEDLNVDHRAYPTKGESRQTISIQATALDDYFQPDSRVDLVKVDIQGYELHALRGATRLLRDNPKIKLLLEFWPYGLSQAGSSAEELLSLLSQNDFKAFSINHGRLVEFRYTKAGEADPANYHNLFAQR